MAEEMFDVLHPSGKDKNFVNPQLKVGGMGVQLFHKGGIPIESWQYIQIKKWSIKSSVVRHPEHKLNLPP